MRTPDFSNDEAKLRWMVQHGLIHVPGLHGLHAAVPHPAHAESDPDPDPWIPSAVARLMRLIALKEAGARLPDATRKQFVAKMDASISAFIDDDICPTIHWPFPGPPPWSFEAVAELTMIANSLAEGPLRTAVTGVADRVMQKAISTFSAS